LRSWLSILGLVIVLQAVASWLHHQGKSSRWPSLAHIVWHFEAKGPAAWVVVLLVWLWLGYHFLVRRTLPVDWHWK